ncbi:MAG: FHA domain-containing protein [Symploca sp. SIO3C6]|uniref:FHA domain-containing protein n=1 Tax=Symploca sp. SIO1C4 TaxID=2607765 RepID=A0A6B3MZB9_9CYAN|nr:FHA domain-containing protein [Symploca sp. SIO3C6]NER26786.1 FHA domain-containing protein [Symploca sp. SIO1C4]NET07182.1 FHA domain-containing protein [Symploca sp. SIO2B6]NET50289.1 FHA domain-containing protein [Merismopedia sp. SIO2A8]
MITLTLLHPLQSLPVQEWPFENESVIRIGRSTDNEVILYSAVVSRHHVELRREGSEWEIFSLGANGTYIDGKRITKMSVLDGMIIRLASSGPKIQIHLQGETDKTKLEEVLGKRPSSAKRTLEPPRETFINYQIADPNGSKFKSEDGSSNPSDS